ncbi:MAG: YgfZ/GcvT domain-containing protein [Bryobacteraceae bacterium]
MTGYEALRGNCAWVNLSMRGKLRVIGEDRARLLHAMSTNHIEGLQPSDGLYAFFLTAQGRILADANIYNRGESLLLDTEPEICDKLRNHLDKYIIADEVTIEDETAQWAAIGLEGPQSLECAKKLGIPAPQEKYSVTDWGAGFVARTARTGPEGIRIFVLPRDEADVLSRCAELAIPNATASEARIVRLENGIPRYGDDITEKSLPQETQAMHAVHFNKGCYLGQEIVERVRSRAQIHRLLTPIRIQSSLPPAPGAKLSADGKDLGEITSAEYSLSLGEVVGLAYIRTEAARDEAAMFVTGSNPPVTVRVV